MSTQEKAAKWVADYAASFGGGAIRWDDASEATRAVLRSEVNGLLALLSESSVPVPRERERELESALRSLLLRPDSPTIAEHARRVLSSSPTGGAQTKTVRFKVHSHFCVDCNFIFLDTAEAGSHKCAARTPDAGPKPEPRVRACGQAHEGPCPEDYR